MKYHWCIIGRLSDVGGSGVVLDPCFYGTGSEAVRSWDGKGIEDDGCCVIDVVARRCSQSGEDVLMDNADGNLRYMVYK